MSQRAVKDKEEERRSKVRFYGITLILLIIAFSMGTCILFWDVLVLFVRNLCPIGNPVYVDILLAIVLYLIKKAIPKVDAKYQKAVCN